MGFKPIESVDQEYAPQGRGFTPIQEESQINRQLLRTARIAAEGVGALPLMAADAGIAARNILTGDNYQSASGMYADALDSIGLPRPQGMVEKSVDIAGQMLIGSKIPNPSPKTPIPKQMPLNEGLIRQQTIKESMDAGYRMPPATANPTPGNIVTESVSGKAQTAQAASAMNQKVTNRLVSEELGIPKGVPITVNMLNKIRQRAGNVYKAITSTGTIKADDDYVNGLSEITKSIDDVARDFPDANLSGNKDISKLVDSLLQDSFSAKGAIEYIKQLRKEATSAFKGEYDPAKQALGMAKREAAEVLEDLITRHLTANGQQELAQQLSKSRQLIAKTYSVEAALNESTGNVVASKLAQQLAKGRPLSGKLMTVAKFARAFPKASDEVKYSPGVSAVDALIGIGGGSTIDPVLYGLPLARVMARYGTLSKPGQRALINESIPKPQANIAVPAAMAAQQGGSSLYDLIQRYTSQ